MTPQEKLDKIRQIEEDKKAKLCDHCLGRQFARLGHGLENYERSLIIKNKEEVGEEIKEDSFTRDEIPDQEPEVNSDCLICQGLFNHLDKYAQRIFNALDRFQFDTFLIGSRPPADVVKNEEELWEQVGIEYTEPVKSEINRLLGKRVEAELEAVVDFNRPDVTAICDIRKDRVELDINSLYIYGEYSKLERGIPQTKWYCSNCQGEGCEECDWTGKMYQTSVEEIIAESFIAKAKGTSSKFHGQGREDIDARCLGQRPFVLEVLEPRKRDLNLEKLQEEVNQSEAVQIYNLRFCDKDKVQELKTKRSDKKYRILIELKDEVPTEELEKLKELEGTIKQKTPSRVEHRRAQKTRKRELKKINWKRVEGNPQQLELTIKGEAGLYIKELVTGDKDKTKPSVAQILPTEVDWIELDVIEVEK